ncbi:MAG: hypothetical protein HQ580_19270 [Planctomycetes bacterium]|nr:hypothetical protein [Planctomycetota bacterium]
MIGCDRYVVEFIAGNMVSITLAIMLIKGLARITSFKWDDKVAELFESVFSFATQRKIK